MNIAYSENLNRGRFTTWTNKPEMNFIQVTQTHGIDIASLETLPCEADGLIVSWEDFEKPLAIKTADCMPIIIEGEKGVVFIHAGWRGLANGILEKPEVHMINPQRVLIGPSIHECCFEVSEDFKEHFPKSPFFKQGKERCTFSLQDEAKRQLKLKFPNLLIEVSRNCTCCDKTFHSYRRDKTTQRNWNLYIKG